MKQFTELPHAAEMKRVVEHYQEIQEQKQEIERQQKIQFTKEHIDTFVSIEIHKEASKGGRRKRFLRKDNEYDFDYLAKYFKEKGYLIEMGQGYYEIYW